jgi:two-component system OmpR family response regulator
MTHQPHILIVEDDREVSGLISRFLHANEMRVSVAKDSHEMDRELKTARIDLAANYYSHGERRRC